MTKLDTFIACTDYLITAISHYHNWLNSRTQKIYFFCNFLKTFSLLSVLTPSTYLGGLGSRHQMASFIVAVPFHVVYPKTENKHCSLAADG